MSTMTRTRQCARCGRFSATLSPTDGLGDSDVHACLSCLQRLVDQWNADHALGTPVRAWPGVRPEGRTVLGTTRTPAWLLGSTPCVSVTGYPGGIALTHIEVLP